MSSDFRQGMMVGALLVACVLVVFVVSHAQVSVSVFGLSKHSDSGYCEVNPGAALNYAITPDLHLIAGRYKNSKCRQSNVAGFGYCAYHFWRLCFGTALLRLTGYSEKAIYAPLPMASYEGDGYAIDAIGAKRGEEVVIGFGVRFQL